MYTIEGGFVTVKVRKDREAVVASRGGRPKKLPADSELVAEAAKNLCAYLFGERESRVRLEEVVAAYERILKARHLKVGDNVAI